MERERGRKNKDTKQRNMNKQEQAEEREERRSSISGMNKQCNATQKRKKEKKEKQGKRSYILERMCVTFPRLVQRMTENFEDAKKYPYAFCCDEGKRGVKKASGNER